MAYDSTNSDASAGPSIGRYAPSFPTLLASTLAFVSATVLLGVAAKATGSGLACNANWPLCDGGVLDLFPATFPSFFEWIHRVVAMVAGFFIVGTVAAAWRLESVDRRVTAAVTLGLVLTPIQVLLGRETVLSYELTILSLHFWTAVAIFAAFALATVYVWARRISTTHVTAALAAGAALVPVHVAVSPLYVGTYTPVVQTFQYAVTLGLVFVAILAAAVGPRRFDRRLVTGTLGVAVSLTFLAVLFGRRAVMTYAPTLEFLYVVVAGALFVAFVGGAVLARRVSATPSARGV